MVSVCKAHFQSPPLRIHVVLSAHYQVHDRAFHPALLMYLVSVNRRIWPQFPDPKKAASMKSLKGGSVMRSFELFGQLRTYGRLAALPTYQATCKLDLSGRVITLSRLPDCTAQLALQGLRWKQSWPIIQARTTSLKHTESKVFLSVNLSFRTFC